MGLRVDVFVGFEGSEKNFLELHLNQDNIREIGKVADVIEELKKLGKTFGFA